jgi:purine-binding chemotaxis protein CheW
LEIFFMKMNGETTLSTIPKPGRPVRSIRKASCSPVDWEVLHRKVLESSSRLDLTDEAPTGVLEQAWARRAAQIAREIEAEETGNQIEIVVVRLGKELYGLEAGFVFDIRPLENITPVPRVPDWVAGVVNLRGRIISVLDLQRYLNLPHPVLEEDDYKASPHLRYLVVTGAADMEIALLVNDILGVESISNNQIRDSIYSMQGIPTEYVKGLVEHRIRGVPQNEDNPDGNIPSLVVILDIAALLTDRRLVIHDSLT